MGARADVVTDAMTVDARTTTDVDGEGSNTVLLCGRLSVAPDARELGSGDRLVLLRVMVPRADGRGEDSIPVSVGPTAPRSRGRRGHASSRVVREVAELEAGAEVRVAGWIERRFFVGGSGQRTSRVRVVATHVERVGQR